MIKSMTGFGSSDYSDGNRNISVEIRTVNHRYADITVRLPRRYVFAEDAVKKSVKKYVRRGKVEISVTVENVSDKDVRIVLNKDLAKQYYDNLSDLRSSLGIAGEVSLEYIASLPDVLRQAADIENEEEVTASLCHAVEEAAAKLDDMRSAEGAKLAEDIMMRAGMIDKMAAEVEKRSPDIVREYTEKLDKRITELVEKKIDAAEERILLEAAVFADKINVTEETVRLHSHVLQLNSILDGSSQPDGKKLDFIVQEMNREANTIGSKANDLYVTNTVLEMKSEIEKIREQVQNIE